MEKKVETRAKRRRLAMIQRMREEHAKKELEKEIQVPALVHVLVCACLHSHLGLRMHELA